MIPAAFDYFRPESVEEALSSLAAAGEDAKLLAGGHSLLPLMKLRLAQPTALVDIRTLAELRGIRLDDGVVRIGGAVRHRELESSVLLREHAPLLAQAAGTIGDPQVRSRGTIGGTLAHADPAADLPAVLLALGATIVARSVNGDREIAIDSFFVDFWETALRPDEILAEVRIPSTRGLPWSYQKFQQRKQDWAIVAVAALGGADPRVALVNMALTPMRAAGVEEALRSGAGADEAAERADEQTSPSSDLRADEAYRRHLCQVLTRRAVHAWTASPAHSAGPGAR